MKKKGRPKKVKSDPPIVVAIPSTTKEKMTAIVNVSQAILELTKAINGTNVDVTIKNAHINNAQIGIKIERLD